MSKFRKALVAAGVGFAGALGASCSDGKITVGEVVVALGVGLVAGAATYRVPNAG